MNTGDCAGIHFDGSELPLREDLPVILEFFQAVRPFRRIDALATLDNRLVVGGRDEPDAIVRGKHGELPFLMLQSSPFIRPTSPHPASLSVARWYHFLTPGPARRSVPPPSAWRGSFGHLGRRADLRSSR